MKETPEQQAANRELRKGMKRPEHGEWPVAKLGNSKAKALKKVGMEIHRTPIKATKNLENRRKMNTEQIIRKQSQN